MGYTLSHKLTAAASPIYRLRTAGQSKVENLDNNWYVGQDTPCDYNISLLNEKYLAKIKIDNCLNKKTTSENHVASDRKWTIEIGVEEALIVQERVMAGFQFTKRSNDINYKKHAISDRSPVMEAHCSIVTKNTQVPSSKKALKETVLTELSMKLYDSIKTILGARLLS